MATVEGAWVPNWLFDAICLAEPLAGLVSERYAVTLLPVQWRGTGPGAPAQQIVVPSTAEPWFDPGELAAATAGVHGVPGASCDECRRWRWMPIASEALPRLQVRAEWEDQDVIASSEWFGDGWKCFREMLLKRELGEMIAAASPDDFEVRELEP